MKILMVCLGNICRSPMADGLLRKKVDENNLAVEVDSAGTASFHIGALPDERMRETGRKHHVPIDDLHARQFETADFDSFDAIYVMDDSNYQNVLRLARNNDDEQKVEYILNLAHPGKNLPVPDPYYGGEQGFEDVFQLLDEATDVLIEQLKSRN